MGRKNLGGLAKTRSKKYYPDKQKEWRKNNRIRNLLNAIKSKCNFYNLPFNISEEDLIVPEFCPVLGIPLIWTDKKSDNTPSVDRLIPVLGYTKGNICIISSRANLLKNNATIEEIEKILQYMKKHIDI